MLRVLDIFSGIGGFTLGLERTGGFRTVAFCEQDRFCRAVLDTRWPGVAKFRDVRFLDRRKLANFLPIDVICGGFPCQDISFAGKGAGITGERSGLWSEYARLIGELRPSYAIVENVSALLVRGLGRVLRDLAEVGYDAEWHCIPASSLGAPHRRDRIWIVAYPNGQGEHDGTVDAKVGVPPKPVADPDQPRLSIGKLLERLRREAECGDEGEVAALDGELPHPKDNAADSARVRRGVSAREWRSEPDVGRVAHGVPNRVDRLQSLGNAVVPQIPEIIGQAILEAEKGFVR